MSAKIVKMIKKFVRWLRKAVEQELSVMDQFYRQYA